MVRPERFGAVQARSIEADSITLRGNRIQQAIGGRALVTGSLDFAAVLPSVDMVVACMASPWGPGYSVTAQVYEANRVRIEVWRTGPNGLTLVPATVPVEVNWIALGS